MATHCCRVHKAKQWSWLVPLLFDEEGKGFAGEKFSIYSVGTKVELSHLASLGLGAFQYDADTDTTSTLEISCPSKILLTIIANTLLLWELQPYTLNMLGSLLKCSHNNLIYGIKSPSMKVC